MRKSASKSPLITTWILIGFLTLVAGLLTYRKLSQPLQNTGVQTPTPSPQITSVPTPSPTEPTLSWSTYTSKTPIPFSFKYPPHWQRLQEFIFIIDGNASPAATLTLSVNPPQPLKSTEIRAFPAGSAQYSWQVASQSAVVNGFAVFNEAVTLQFEAKNIPQQQSQAIQSLVDQTLFSLRILAPTPTPAPSLSPNTCRPAGCNNELCVADAQANDIVSTCIYKPEFACYKQARCELQNNGQCGWSQTPELISCLESSASQ